jgi:hypothetical protein
MKEVFILEVTAATGPQHVKHIVSVPGCHLSSANGTSNSPHSHNLAPPHTYVVEHWSFMNGSCKLRITQFPVEPESAQRAEAETVAAGGINPRCYCCGESSPCLEGQTPICQNNHLVGCTERDQEGRLVQLESKGGAEKRAAKKGG